MSKDAWHGGFNGMMKYWYLNHGEGTYRTKDYGEGETDELTFGYSPALTDREMTKEWEFEEELINNEWDQSETKIQIEMNDGEDYKINGITEYGYGFWSRFLWNGLTYKLVDKGPHCNALTRLTIQPNY